MWSRFIVGVAIVWAKTEDGPAKSIRGFLWERDFQASNPKMKQDEPSRIRRAKSCWRTALPDEKMLPGVEGLKAH